MTYDEYRNKMIKETMDFHGITAWHEMGYKGKGIRILEAENFDSEHGQYVVKVMKIVAPESEVFLGGIGCSTSGGEITSLIVKLESGTLYDDDAIEFLSTLDIVAASMAGSSNKPLQELLVSLGITILNAAGNDGNDGVTGIYRDYGISVGAIYTKSDDEIIDIDEIKKESYSASGDEELDFAVLHMDKEGTSFADPVFAGMVALIESRYRNLTQEEIYEVMKSISLDAGELGFDTSFGWGVPVLPESIEMLEVENVNKPNKIIMHHSSTDDDNYSNDYDAIEWYHTVVKGWNDIAYHWIVEYDNGIKVKKGRDELVTGAHTLGQNAESIGICLVGNFDLYEPSSEQYETLVRLICEIRLRHGNLPLYRHSDFAQKTCPGVKFDMAEIDYPKDLSEWAKDAYNYEVANGLTDGTRPKDPVTREENWVTDYRFHLLEEKLEKLL